MNACKSARAYLDARGIHYTELDVELSPSARTLRDRLNPKRTVPTIDVEGQVLIGFSSERLDKMIDNAARKHAQLKYPSRKCCGRNGCQRGCVGARAPRPGRPRSLLR